MRLKPYPEKDDGKRVWLRDDELEQLIDQADGTTQTIALLLAGRAGLRRKEITMVTPADLVETPTGTHLRIWEDVGKKEHYREPPVPERLATRIRTAADMGGIEDDDPIVDVDPRTVYRWMKRAAEQCGGYDPVNDDWDDVGWSFLDVHDLRRTWGTYLLEQGVLPSVVMSWGGWKDWSTFRRHYLGEFSPEGIRRERSKVNYLEGESGTEDRSFNVVPSGSDTSIH